MSQKEEKITKEEEVVIEKLLTGDDKESQKIVSENYCKYTSKELNQMLDEAVHNEDYEKAAAIRDEISKREK